MQKWQFYSPLESNRLRGPGKHRPFQRGSAMKNQTLAAAALALPLLAAAPAHAEAPEALVQPAQTIVDSGIPAATAQAMILAARRYDTFWDNGDARYARAALAPDFVDHTLPAGRLQGPEGPIAASAGFRQAVPDLRAEVGQMIVAGDRVSVFLHFTGHFTGKFGEHQGKGQAIDFIAMDIYRIRDGRIAEDWHLEDNLTLLKQMDAVATR